MTMWHSPETFCDPRSVRPEKPGARAAHSCDVIAQKLFVFGGWNGVKALNDLYILDARNMNWSLIRSTNPPPARNNHATAVVGFRLYTHGGHDGESWLDDLHVLDTEPLVLGDQCSGGSASSSKQEAAQWLCPSINGKAPSKRACHTLSRVHEKLYMFGGYDGDQCFNEIEILDIATMSWIQPKMKGQIPQARNAHTMTVIDTSLFLFGGHSGAKHLTDLHVFETTTLEWTQPQLTGSPPPGLRGHTANLVGEKILLFGGYDGKGRSNDLYILDTATKKWLHTPEAENAPCGRQRHSASLAGSKQLLIFGGFDGSRWLNDLHAFDIGRLAESALADEAVHVLVDNMKWLLETGEYSDITLVVEGRPIACHKCVLASQCAYFHKMFSSTMVESRETEISIPEWSYTAFYGVLEFLYTGKLSVNSPQAVREVLGLADQYGLDSLKSLCETVLIHNLDFSTVCVFLKDADRYMAEDLKRRSLDFVIKHADILLQTNQMEELQDSPALMMEVLAKTVKRNNSPITTSKLGLGGTETPPLPTPRRQDPGGFIPPKKF